MNCRQVWRSGMVARWHSNPDMVHTAQTNAQHQWGAAVLAMHLFPEDHELLRASLLHDAPEMGIGDMCGLAKRENPELRAAVSKAEAVNAERLGVVTKKTERLSLCDMIEAYLWVHHHNRKILEGDGWPEMLDDIYKLANKLGVNLKVCDLLFSFKQAA